MFKSDQRSLGQRTSSSLGRETPTKNSLKQWSINNFGLIDTSIASLEDTIHEVDQVVNSRNLTEEEIDKRKVAQSELWSLLKRREIYWAQNSRVKWIREGD